MKIKQQFSSLLLIMKKKLFLFATALLFSVLSYAQTTTGVAINATGADAATSAILDVSSITKGALVPRMTATQRGNIVSPATGLLVFQTDAPEGFYYYNASSTWVYLTNTAGVLAIVNGGTGSSTQNFVDLSTTQTVAGAKTFSSDLTVNGLTVGRGGGDSIFNTAVGAATLQSNTTGHFNTAVGAGSISANDSGSFNTAIGSGTLYSNNTGNYNTANGIFALYSNTSGMNNTANGDSTLFSNTTGSYNTANGSMALSSNTEGDLNTAIGILALQSNTMGGGNTALGLLALHSNTTGNTNTGIGAGADVASGALTNATAIGAGAIVAASNTIQLGNTNVENVKTSGTITAGDVTYPNTIGTDGYYLKMNGTGSASWASVSSSAVPYTGALYAVNLGAHDLTVNGLTVGKGHLSVGDNTAIGNAALHSNTTGDYNTAAGAYSLYSNTTGYSNTATGQGTLNSNTTGHNNTANGTGTLNSNTSGNQNTATGQGALQYNLTGSFNTANGVSALGSNESGSSNTAYGVSALESNTTGDGNTAIGTGADVASGALTNATAIGNGASVVLSNTIQLGNTLVENVKTFGTITAGAVTYPNTAGTSGDILTTNGTSASWATPGSFSWGLTGNADTDSTTNFIGTTDNKALVFKVNSQKAGEVSSGTNTSFGYQTLNENTTGNANTAIGDSALFSNTTGSVNTANGAVALFSNTTGSCNTANGYQALYSNTTGDSNTANGCQALYSNTTGISNTANGRAALHWNTTGSSNTANGYAALLLNTTGSYNTANGYLALYSNTTGSSNIANGHLALASNTTGEANTANGNQALNSNTTGSSNTANGFDAGNYTSAISDGYTGNETSSNSVYLGALTKAFASGDNNEIVIGYDATGAGSNTATLGNTSITSTVLRGDVSAKRYVLTQPSDIASAGTTTIDLSLGNVFQVGLGANIGTLTLTNPAVGTYLVKFTQDATGGRTVAFPAAWKWSGGSVPTVTATLNKTDIVTLIYDGTTYYAAIVQNF